MADESPCWPTEIKVSSDRRQLTIIFDDGKEYALSAELLRVCSPSAEVQGHSPDQRVTVSGKRDVEIMRLVPVGSYAVRIEFDDMHDTGIFSWTYLRDLGENAQEKMAAYFAELEEKGLGRDSTRRQ